ncbi:hypothetical protein U3516DRAFT_886242 [Neocallimastix sp. 'constans']
MKKKKKFNFCNSKLYIINSFFFIIYVYIYLKEKKRKRKNYQYNSAAYNSKFYIFFMTRKIIIKRNIYIYNKYYSGILLTN